MKKLDPLTIEQNLEACEGWKIIEEKWLTKKYRFQSYLDGIAFVNQVAELSEKENHHPFISIDYKLITLKLTSWEAGGITELDFKLIKLYDHIYQDS